MPEPKAKISRSRSSTKGKRAAKRKRPVQPDFTICLKRPHPLQAAFIQSTAKRKIIRAGRRGGKTTGVAILALHKFLAGHRVLYAAPTQEQIERFWKEVKQALATLIDAGVLIKNETLHVIERPGTEQRIRAKTAWNADTLRGDYADLLILDEWQLMDEDAWETVGAPMLLDYNGDAVFIYTPPSLRSRSTSKARDPRHASKMFANALTDETGRWATFHFRSKDNPHISAEALDEITADMTSLAYRQEIMAEDIDEVPGAMWTRAMIESGRVRLAPELKRIVIGIDPSATSRQGSDEAGIIAVGLGIDNHAYVLADGSLRASPDRWAREAVVMYHRLGADRIVAETNNGGDMVALTLRTVDPSVSYKAVHASHSKQTRAEPIVALYEQGKVHHVGNLAALEDEMCSWAPGDASPNRMDACVWALTELMLQPRMRWRPFE
jgi:hypothetical protein